MSGGLLNPPQHDDLAKKLIRATSTMLEKVDTKLLSSAMDERQYLQTIGARLYLADLLKEQQQTYNSEVMK